MAFRRFVAWAPVVAGAALGPLAALAAWRDGLYATAAWLVCAAVVLALITLARLSRRPPASPPPPAAFGESERRLLKTMLDQSPGVLVALGPDDVLRAVNRAARRLFDTDDRVVTPPEPLMAALRETAPGSPASVALQGGIYSLAIADVTTAAGSTRLASLLDIRSELQAAEASAMRETLEVVGHEIMNSLTPILSLSQTAAGLLVDRTPEAQTSAAEALAILSRRAQGLARFVQGYRSLTRLPPPSPGPVGVNDLLSELSRLFAAHWSVRGVRLVLRPLAREQTVTLDREQVLQALLNLAANAAQAALDRADVAPVVTLDARLGADLIFTVTDTGAGLPDDLRDAVFRPFVTTRADGTGVGLSLVRQIARAHGGDVILAPAAADRGAEFSLSLALK